MANKKNLWIYARFRLEPRYWHYRSVMVIYDCELKKYVGTEGKPKQRSVYVRILDSEQLEDAIKKVRWLERHKSKKKLTTGGISERLGKLGI